MPICELKDSAHYFFLHVLLRAQLPLWSSAGIIRGEQNRKYVCYAYPLSSWCFMEFPCGKCRHIATSADVSAQYSVMRVYSVSVVFWCPITSPQSMFPLLLILCFQADVSESGVL